MTFPIAPWAATANYPAGGNAWSSTQTKVNPAYTYFTPNQPPSAQELNYMFNQRDLAQSAMGTNLTNDAVANWSPIKIGSSGANGFGDGTQAWQFADVKFDPDWGWWVAVAFTTTPTTALLYSDDGLNWAQLAWAAGFSNVSHVPRTMVVLPSSKIVVMRNTAANAAMHQTLIDQQAGTNVDSASLAVMTRGGAVASQGTMFYHQANGAAWFVGASGFGGTGAWTGFITSNNNDGNSASWTDLHGSAPASFVSGTGGVWKWESAQNTTTAIVAMCAQRPGTDPSFLMKIDAAGTMTDITPGFVGSSQAIRGIAWSAVDQLWGLVTQDSGPNVYLYFSPDLVNWTAVSPGGTPGTGVGLAAVRGTWALGFYEAIAQTIGRIGLYTGIGQWLQSGNAGLIGFSWAQFPWLSLSNNSCTLLLSSEFKTGVLEEALSLICCAINGAVTNGVVAVTQSNRSTYVAAPVNSGVATASILPGWNTALDLDFSTLPTTTYGADGTFALGPYTNWTKVRSANDRTPLTNSNGSGLIFRPTASHTGGGVFLPLSAFLPGNVNLWSTALRIWVYLNSQNFTNNGDNFRVGLGLTTSSVALQPAGLIGVNGSGAFIEAAYGAFPSVQQLSSFTSNTNTMLLETLALDSTRATYLCGQYTGGAWPAEAGAIVPVAAVDAMAVSSGILQFTDPSSTTFYPSTFGLIMFPVAAGGSTLTVTVGRIRVDYRV
jgi:hypothetical protein